MLFLNTFFWEKLIYGRKKEHMASYLSLSARHNWADVIISSTLFLKSFCTPLPSVHHPCHEIISGGFTKDCNVIIWRKSHEKPFQIIRKPIIQRPKKVMIEVLRKIFFVDSNYPIRSRYCTCHDSIAVVACATLWPDCINVLFCFVFLSRSDSYFYKIWIRSSSNRLLNDHSCPRSGQLVPKTTHTQNNSYPGQLVPKTTRT